MDIPLLRTLTDFGFTDKEARVYLALLELGEGNVTHIAQKTGLKRAIIYIVLERLMQQGYASRTGRGKVQRFTAIGDKPFAGPLRTKPEQLDLFEALNVAKPV